MSHSLKARWRTLSPLQRTFASACGAMLVGWTAVLLSPAARQGASVASPVTVPELSAPAAQQVRPSEPAVPATSAPAAAPTSDPLAALRLGLASDNAGTRIEALRAARAQHLSAALPELLQRDLAHDPDAAPTLIQTCAQLAQEATPQQRTAAMQQLGTWLHEASARNGDAARGEVSVLVETLASWRGQEVAPVLADTLQDERIPLHVQTVAVEGLGRLRAGTARAALTAFRARIAQSPPQAGFELELNREAVEAADRALARLTE